MVHVKGYHRESYTVKGHNVKPHIRTKPKKTVKRASKKAPLKKKPLIFVCDGTSKRKTVPERIKCMAMGGTVHNNHGHPERCLLRKGHKNTFCIWEEKDNLNWNDLEWQRGRGRCF